MKKILIMDAKDYDNSMEEIYRIAIRGIIFIDGKLLLVESSFGEIKLPGGGVEKNESDIDTLIRETYEETGYHIIPDSIKPFGEVEEKRLSIYEAKIWHQINRYYFCDVISIKDKCDYTEDENKDGFHQVFYTIDEAIKINEEMQE